MTATTTAAPGGRPVTRDPLWRAVGLLDVSWRRAALAVLAGAGALGSAVALAAVSAWLIARASQMPPVMQLSIAAVAVRTFGVSRGVLRYLERLASHDVALRGVASLRGALYDRLAVGRTEPLLALRRGDLLARVGADADAVGDVVVRGLVPAAVAVVVGAGSVVLVGVFLPTAGAALAACLLLAGGLAPWWAARSVRTAEAAAADARAETTALALVALDGAAELRVAGRMPVVLDELRGADARLARATDVGARPAALAAAAGPLSTGLAVLAALALGVPATTGGLLTPVELAVVVLTPLAAFEGTALLPAAAVQVLRSRQAATRVMDLLDAVAEETVAAPSDRGGDAPGPSLRPDADAAVAPGSPRPGVLRARDLACGWPGREPVVRGLDLDLAPGRRVAVVGPSGTGKTTLLLTLAGLLPPAAGELLVDGVAPSARTRADAAATVSVTPEDAHVFDTTVLENLRVARGDVTVEEAREVLGVVGLGPWLQGLPDGLGTTVGSDAARLSGGERRRLLVARALLSPAPLLLLDEPTEHLDTGTARDVGTALAPPGSAPGAPDGTAGAEALLRGLLDGCLAPGRGILVATHRLTGVEAADEVIVLEGGAVRARGTHDQLMAADPTYRWAWRAQTETTDDEEDR